MRKILIALLLVSLPVLASVKSSTVPAFVSAVLPASGAWANGSAAVANSAEVAKLYCTYTTHASSTTGYPDLKVMISTDGTTYNDYAICADDAAKAAATGVDEYQAECLTRIWYIATPGVAATAEDFPVLEFDLRGVKLIRVSGREIGDGTNRGSLECNWGLGEITR